MGHGCSIAVPDCAWQAKLTSPTMKAFSIKVYLEHVLAVQLDKALDADMVRASPRAADPGAGAGMGRRARFVQHPLRRFPPVDE